jgi:peptide deformylase
MEPSSGTARPITLHGTAVLHTPCAPVTVFDDDLSRLIEDMFASMYAARGVGLAANQIGVGQRVFVYDCRDVDGVRHVGHMVNPILQTASALARTIVGAEGCLSLPGAQADLGRSGLATVTGFDRTGAPITVSGTGEFARCLQHETDHLNGIVYVDRLDPQRRTSVLAAAAIDG